MTERPKMVPVSGRAFVASGVLAARFLPVWLATGALAIVAAVVAPNALKSTSWAFVLPYMTVLAIAALGQMLVIMHAGIDLSTPGVIALGGNLIAGIGADYIDNCCKAATACRRADRCPSPRGRARRLRGKRSRAADSPSSHIPWRWRRAARR